MSNAMDIQAPTWDLSQIFSGFDGTDYQQALADYTAGMDELDKRLADVTAQQSDFSRWFIMSYFVNTKKSTGLRCISYTACLYSSSLRWKDSYISSGTL